MFEPGGYWEAFHPPVDPDLVSPNPAMDKDYPGRGGKTLVTRLSCERTSPFRSLSPLACPKGSLSHWLKRQIDPQNSH